MSICDVPPPAPVAGAVRASPAIGVGIVADPVPSVDLSRLSRYRVRADRAGLHLRGGESVLCAPYEPAELGLVVLVQCETDGHSPGVLLPAGDLDYLEPALESCTVGAWSTPSARRGATGSTR